MNSNIFLVLSILEFMCSVGAKQINFKPEAIPTLQKKCEKFIIRVFWATQLGNIQLPVASFVYMFALFQSFHRKKTKII